MVDGIEIDKDIAEETLLPDDLNSLAVGSYVVPDPRKRKQYPYVVLGVVVLSLITSLIIDFVSFILVIIILSIIALLLFLVNNKFKILQQEVIERITNKGSDAAARCIEIASGAELTEQEINATKKSEINRECPSIANPNYVPY